MRSYYEATARERIVTLEQSEAGLRAELAASRDQHARERQRADRATSKWESDRASLDRAKDALAVALAQIEETEGRALD